MLEKMLKHGKKKKLIISESTAIKVEITSCAVVAVDSKKS